MEQFEAINDEQAYTRWKEGSAALVDEATPPDVKRARGV